MGRDEEGTVRVLSAHRAVIDGIIAFHNGRILSTAGDSVLAEFSSVVEAVRCAVEIQDALKTRNDALAEHRRMQFRIGINLGDVMVKNDDLLGDGVNVAARLEGIAEPGGICISSSVYDQITGKLDLGFLDIGEQNLKNISRPIRVFRISGSASPSRPALPAAPAAPAPRKLPLVALVAVAGLATATVVAWRAGWVHFGGAETANPTSAIGAPAPPTPVTAPASPVDSSASRAQSEAERLRADAERLKHEADAELAQARSETNAARAAKSKMAAESAAPRGKAADDAARTQSVAEAAATRTRAEPKLAPVGASTGTAQTASTMAKGDTPGGAPSPSTARPPQAESTMHAATTADTTSAYDGIWNVTVVCPMHGDGALGYTLEFVAQIKNGFLRGQQGSEDSPSWLRLEGPIGADGSAVLDARGRTGDPKYTVSRAARGSPYAYTVAARFDGSHGTGRRLELRACDLRFVKQ